jgi:hypothetical protein
MAAACAAAVALSWAVSRLHLEPGSLLAAGAAAAAVALLFAVRPAEGLGAFLLFSLLANTTQYLLKTDLFYFDEIGLLFFVPIAVVRYGVPNRRLRLGTAEIALAAVAVAGVTSSLANAVPFGIWFPGLLLLMKGVFFFYMVAWLPLRIAEVIRVGVVIVAVATGLLALGFVELVNPAAFQRAVGLPLYEASRGGIPVIKSLFLHPGVLGWMAAFIGLFMYVRYLVTRSWWSLALGMAMTVGSMMSGRRTPILGLLIGLVVGAAWLWLRRPASRALFRSALLPMAAVALVAVVLAGVAGFYTNTLKEYRDSGRALVEILSDHRDPAQFARVAPRTVLYATSVAIARDHFPLGVGLGRFGTYMSRRDYSPVYHEYGLDRVAALTPDNPVAIDDTFWPAVLGETGPIGLAGFLTFIITVLARLWRAIPTSPSPAWLALALGGLVTFVQGIVASLTAASYVAPPIAYFVFAAAGVVLAIGAGEGHHRDAVAPS